MQTQLIGSSGAPLFDIFGPLLQFLVTPAQTSGSFALMRGVVAPGIAIPLHSHADPEVLFVLHGGLEVLQSGGDSGVWLAAKPGETICIPSNVKHALRNASAVPATVLLITTPNVCSFFRELGKPFHSGQRAGQPTPEDMHRLQALAAKYNYWMASPQENAAIGLSDF
jgi:quercetin dioxygenase-like cupin family protein